MPRPLPFFLAALAVALPAWAALPVPSLTGRVVDGARVFSAEEREALDRRLAALEASTGAQMAVLSVPTLDDEPIERFSMRVAEAWKLGRKGSDRGLLFVFAPTARKMRLEVGYGLEGSLPDAVAKRIEVERARPYFADGQYAKGTIAVVDAVSSRLGGRSASAPTARERPGNDISGLVFFVLLIAFASILLGAGRRRRRYWSGPLGGYGGGYGGGGFGGGGGFSGGGGGFGGGGASSDW